MKINLENMKELADKTAYPVKYEELGIDVDDICTMAYQLQYFFEVIEKLELLPGTSWADARTAEKIIDLFDSAIIDKEE